MSRAIVDRHTTRNPSTPISDETLSVDEESVVMILKLIIADRGTDIGVLHLHIDPVILPKNTPGHASAGDPERDGAHVAQFDGVDAGQNADKRARSLLLHRSRVQHVVHHRDPDALHLVSE